jgi:lipoyl(octanoyl) transferase
MDWQISEGLTDYPQAQTFMEARADAIAAGDANELCWLVEHPPVYTAGTSAKVQDLLAQDFPVYETGRGGQYTYHGPGQRIVYVMLNLKQRYHPQVPDLRDFVRTLEGWIITTLAEFGVRGERRDKRIGIWVAGDRGESKIAALGIRVRKGVSYHGLAINCHPDLSHFGGIVPCGIKEHGVTSLHHEGIPVTMSELDAVLQSTCPFVD